MYCLRHFLCFTYLAYTFSLFAQNDAYDLSQYKARYERRPGMELNFNSNFVSSYQTNLSGGYSGFFSGNTGWFLNRNTDSLISNFEGTSILDIGRSQPPFRSSPL